MVTRHSAVVGTTGAGKSTTVAGILNVLSGCNGFPSARIPILDIHRVYAHVFKDRADVFRVNSDANSDNSSEKSYVFHFGLSILMNLFVLCLGRCQVRAKQEVLFGKKF